MALIGINTITEQVPNEDASITFRPLRRRELRAARRTRQDEVFANLKAMGGELLKDLQSLQTGEVATAAADPLNDFDLDALLAAGIVGWSYGDVVDVELLDQATAEWAGRFLLGLSGVRSEQESFRSA